MPFLSVSQQDAAIRGHCPTFRLVLDAGWIGIWEGTVCPIAVPYLIRIVYFTRRHFRTWTLANPYISVVVLDPPVGPDPRGTGERVPHIYALGHPPAYPRLCLYDPATDEWTPEKPIATTIIPWALDWLYYYEEWVLTGEWKGGGRHPELRSEPCPTPAVSNPESRARAERSLGAAFHSLGRRIGHFGSYLWMEAAFAASSPPASSPSSSAGTSAAGPYPPASTLSPVLRPAA